MNQPTIQILELIIKYGGALGGLLLFFRGYLEYRRANATKRAEFLEKMIAEFNAQEKKVALYMLDDYGYTGALGACPVNMPLLLRNHRQAPIQTLIEVESRQSFDNLLDFYTRLSYYIQNDLMTSRELIYFRYYLEKVRDNPAVIAYIGYYFYPKDFKELFEAIPNEK
jgi:hypothetical protein